MPLLPEVHGELPTPPRERRFVLVEGKWKPPRTPPPAHPAAWLCQRLFLPADLIDLAQDVNQQPDNYSRHEALKRE